MQTPPLASPPPSPHEATSSTTSVTTTTTTASTLYPQTAGNPMRQSLLSSGSTFDLIPNEARGLNASTDLSVVQPTAKKEIAAHVGSFAVLRVLTEYGPKAVFHGIHIGRRLVPTGMNATTFGNVFLGSTFGVLLTNGFRAAAYDCSSFKNAIRNFAANTGKDLVCAAVSTGIYYGVNSCLQTTQQQVNATSPEILTGVESLGPSLVRGTAVALATVGMFAIRKCSEHLAAHPIQQNDQEYVALATSAP